ncbi:hypothetical protein LUZ60_015159 [Juncus effusus]|nr:hypothetical protein LUZ60_015159 [Juncus effusus]
MLDINIFREEKGYDPDRVRESQKRRFANVDVVDEIIELDKELRKRIFGLDGFKKELNKINKEVGKLKISPNLDATELINRAKDIKRQIEEEQKELKAVKDLLNSKRETVGNLVHDSVPISDDEENNLVIRTVGEGRKEEKLKNHVDLVNLLGIVELKKGADVAGSRGYYLLGIGVRLNLALILFAQDFLEARGFDLIETPFFMRRDKMNKCAQLCQFDEELYKVTGEGEDKYLIATSEQPLCAYHADERIYPADLPIRHAGYSTCFRKEVGSHGRDTLGIFRVHQFQKIEQFCITSPNGNDSWDMHEEMLKNAEDFYKELGLPYRVVSVVSGALNLAAAKKYDLEGWFPASQTYGELVSCTNCTDYQSRKLDIAFGQNDGKQPKQFVHILNSTLTATERTMCCILENYQRENGVEIPKVLVPYMGGKTFIPFKN